MEGMGVPDSNTHRVYLDQDQNLWTKKFKHINLQVEKGKN